MSGQIFSKKKITRKFVKIFDYKRVQFMNFDPELVEGILNFYFIVEKNKKKKKM